MDKHSEVEIKFAADGVSLKQYHDLVASLSGEKLTPKTYRIDGYKAVPGKDTYFALNGQSLRFRRGGDREAELTYKQRKSAASITDRVEINIPLKRGVTDSDVKAILNYLGAEEVFTIEKISWIYHITGLVGSPKSPQYAATLALYDVFGSNGNETRRFLEVEIESSSACGLGDALVVLDKWKRTIKNRLHLQGPLNESLFEIYSKEMT